MAMLRRLEGQACCAGRARPWTSVPCSRSRASDWSAQNVHLDADRRMEARRHQRLTREARETAEAEHVAERGLRLAESRRRRSEAAIMECTLTRELEHRQSEKARLAAQVHQACHSNAELRDLQQRCKVERASQERALQLLEAEVAEEEARQHELAALESRTVAWLRDEEAAHAREVARRAGGNELLNELSEQAASSRRNLAVLQDAERREARRCADRAAAQARDEDLDKLRSRRSAQAQLHKALDTQAAERAQQRAEQLAADGEQVQRDQAHFNQKQALAEALADERQQAEDSRQRVLKRLAGALSAGHRETRLLDELREAVASEEREAQQRQADELQLRRLLQSRNEAANACQQSLVLLEQRLHAAAEKEESERLELLRKFAEDEKLEQLGEQRRRAKLLAHRRDVDRIMTERRATREQEQQRELEEVRARRAEEEQAVRIIREERQRLLEAYGLVVHSAQLSWLLSDGARPRAV